MISTSPLQGKRVLVPRGKKYAKSFSEIIRKYGGEPVEIPLLAFRPTQDQTQIKPILERLAYYDWLIFTSITVVETFFSIISDKSSITAKIAVIGEKTEKVLLEKGMEVHFIPSQYVAEGFVKDFLPLVHSGERVLIPKGNLARDVIASSLREKGVIADEVIIYETYFPEESRVLLLELLKSQGLDIISFTSPSTVDHFMSVVNEYNLQENIRDCIITCIGPIAKKRAEKYGLKVDVMPDVYTVPNMVQGTISFLNK